MITITTAARVRAQQIARQRVRDAIKAQGLKTSSVKAAEVSSWAQLYCEDHPQLVAQATVEVTAWIKAGFFGKRAQKLAA